MDKKQIGRPKLYDSTSDKLDAFRKRLGAAGFMRKEVLVTQETWELVTELAKENDVSVSDAASGLLSYGVKTFASKRAASSLSFSKVDEAMATPPPKPKFKTAANPISDFFEKRKALAQSSTGDSTDKKAK